MNTTLQTKVNDKVRVAVPVSKFNFEAYSVQIKHGLPRFPETTSSQTKPCKLWLSRIFQILARTARPSVRSTNFLIVENDNTANAWTARAWAARIFIGFKHPGSSWITNRLPVALWPKTLKHEIQQAGFVKPAESEVYAG